MASSAPTRAPTRKSSVLLVGALLAASASILPATSAARPLAEVMGSGEFELFSTALKRSGLWDRITSRDGITLFVVPDKALRDEGSAFLLDKVLLTSTNQQRLWDLLSYHLGVGVLLPDDVQGELRLMTGATGCLSLARHGSGIRVGPEAVVTDVRRFDGGIVYVIDRLLWQPWRGERNCGEALARVP